MRNKILFCSCVAFSANVCMGQARVVLTAPRACGYTQEIAQSELLTWTADNDAREVIKEITSALSLSPNYQVLQANISTAYAIIQGNTRAIYYGPAFFKDIQAKTKSKWAAISILAHEVGHHLNGHTLEASSRLSDESEADTFSGFIVGVLGGSLQEAQLAISMGITDETESRVYPAKSARLQAIALGWQQSMEYAKREELTKRLHFTLNKYIDDLKNLQQGVTPEKIKDCFLFADNRRDLAYIVGNYNISRVAMIENQTRFITETNRIYGQQESDLLQDIYTTLIREININLLDHYLNNQILRELDLALKQRSSRMLSQHNAVKQTKQLNQKLSEQIAIIGRDANTLHRLMVSANRPKY